jgi:hypothetical protein
MSASTTLIHRRVAACRAGTFEQAIRYRLDQAGIVNCLDNRGT